MLPPEYANAYELWKRPSPSAGDSEPWPIFSRVGATLSEWEALESLMGDLFSIIVESDSAAALRAYGTIANSNGRREALQQAGLIYFRERTDSDDSKDFRTILTNYGEAAGRRNDLAHGMAAQIKDEQGQPKGFWLFPSLHAAKKSRLAQAIRDARENGKSPADPLASIGYLYASRDIDVIRGKVGAFHQEIKSYIQRIAPDFNAVMNVEFVPPTPPQTPPVQAP